MVVAVTASGCAGARIEHGVYRSTKGYSIAVPGPGWMPSLDGRADLQLERRTDGAGMLANAVCEADVARRGLDVLTRHALVGLRDRQVLETDDAPLGGRPAAHAVVEGRMAGAAERVRVELYVTKDERCVYDLIYVAPPAVFDRGRPDFRRFVDSFATR